MGRAGFNQRREICGFRYLEKFVAWADGGPAPAPNAAASQLIELNTTSWDVVKGGPVAAMPLKERLAFATFYAAANDYNTMMERERTAGIGMAEYTGLKRFAPQDADSLSRTIAAFRIIGTQLVGEADAIKRTGAEAGAKAASVPPGPTAALEAFCREVGLN
jgi:hypothetical protein